MKKTCIFRKFNNTLIIKVKKLKNLTGCVSEMYELTKSAFR